MKACFFGSIGVLIESSRLQRLAYNSAFEELGIDLYWNVATYCKLLEVPGGLRRLEAVLGGDWPVGFAEELHLVKQTHFERLASDGLSLRPGIAEALEYCRANSIRLAWVTTTTPEMLETLSRYTAGLNIADFELVCTKDDVEKEKPDPEVYRHALARMKLSTADVVTIEDTPANQAAALAADLQCYLFPGEYAAIDHNLLTCRDVRGAIDSAYTRWRTGSELAA
ncbi:MAG: HAD-IA family hydrolase [Pseudomonadota bacterium]